MMGLGCVMYMFKLDGWGLGAFSWSPDHIAAHFELRGPSVQVLHQQQVLWASVTLPGPCLQPPCPWEEDGDLASATEFLLEE